MMNEKPLAADLTIDRKRNRFRIYRKTLRYLGNPLSIQFLINSEDLYITILGSDKPIASGTTNKVNLNMSIKSCVEFCSPNLMDEIFKIFGTLEFGYSYHLTGEIDRMNHVAYLYLNTLKKIEGRPTDDGQRI
jgi:hypothetical protein